MALVSYDASDSSEYEEDNTEDIKNDLKGSIPIVPTEVHDKENNSEISLFKQLPQPTTAKISSIEEDDEFLHKKVTVKTEQKPKSKIAVPSLSDFKDVANTIPSSKPKVISEKKSGLLSILPQPKNSALSLSKPLIPNVVAQKPHTKNKLSLAPTIKNTSTAPKLQSLVLEYSDESDNDEVQNDFFSINKPVELPVDNLFMDTSKDIKRTSTTTEPRSIESYFKKEDEFISLHSDHVMDTSEDLENSEQTHDDGPGSSSDVVLDEEAIMKLCGSRGKRKREEIQIVDVNGQEVLNEARQWLMKGLMDDTSKRQSSSKKRGNEPTSQQRRKHQITYLAHQAKANEADLQNQWANNRMTKRNAQSKYGF